MTRFLIILRVFLFLSAWTH